MKNLDHVARPSIPWRNENRTECGLDGLKHPTLSRDEFLARVKDYGQQRTYMTTCVTCISTAQRWPTWEQNPAGCLGRHTERYRVSGRSEERDEFRRELLAIALLIERHRVEFDEAVSGLRDIPQLKAARS